MKSDRWQNAVPLELRRKTYVEKGAVVEECHLDDESKHWPRLVRFRAEQLAAWRQFGLLTDEAGDTFRLTLTRTHAVYRIVDRQLTSPSVIAELVGSS